MGKFVGFIGTIRGRVGTTVFSKGENGVSYGRSYQPNVANPKTEGQQIQRAKMNLVGRMSQVTPKELLVTMAGASARKRRSAFNSYLLGAATVDTSTLTGIVAKIAPEDVVFSEGSEVLRAVLGSVSVVATSVTVPLTLADAADADVYGERIIVAIIDPSDKAGYSMLRYKDLIFENTTQQNVVINFPVGITPDSLVCVYRVPFGINADYVRMGYQTISNDGTDIIAKLLKKGDAVRGFGRSVLASSTVFTAA